MVRKRVLILLFVSMVLLGLAACSSSAKGTVGPQNSDLAVSDSSEGRAISVTASSLVADAPQKAETGIESPGLNYESTVQAGLQSYRREMILRFEPEDGSLEADTWQIDTVLLVAEAPAIEVLEILFEGDSPVAEMQSMTVGVRDGFYFLRVPGIGCISISQQDFERSSSGIIDPDYYLAGLDGAPLVATGEIVNGVPALDFGLDGSLLPRFADQDVSVDGHFYVSEEDGHPLRVALNLSGVADFASTGHPQNGTLSVVIDWFATSGSAEVNFPSDCLRSELYPLPEDSFNLTFLDDLVGYETSLSIEQVVAFYESEMAATGWAELEEPTLLDNSAFITFSRNGLEVIVNIEAIPETGLTSVVISP